MCHWGKQRAQPTTRRGSDMSTHTSFLKANSTVNPHLLDGMRCCCLHENITTTTWTQETTCKPRNVAQMTTRIRILYTHILIYNLFIYSIWSFKLAYLMCRFCKQNYVVFLWLSVMGVRYFAWNLAGSHLTLVQGWSSPRAVTGTLNFIVQYMY